MSFATQLVKALTEGAVYSGFLGLFHKGLNNPDWNLSDQAKLTMFWVSARVPTGIVWVRFSNAIISRFGGSPNMAINIATNNLKAIGADFILNKCLYELLFMAGLFKYFDYANMSTPRKREQKEEQSSNTKNESFDIQNKENNLKLEQPLANKKQEEELGYDNSFNLVTLLRGRLKVILGSYFVDAVAPKLTADYFVRPALYFFKTMTVNLIWHVYALDKYFYPVQDYKDYDPELKLNSNRNNDTNSENKSN